MLTRFTLFILKRNWFTEIIIFGDKKIKKIMIVDDDTNFLEEMSEMLQSNGYETIPLCNGDHALLNAWAKNVDLVLLDLKMNGKSGFQVFYELRRYEKTAHIPIIVLTGFYTKENQLQSMSLFDFDKILIKPVKPKDLLESIEHYLQKTA